MNGLSYLLNILICHETLKLVSLSGMFMDHERPFQLVELLSHFLENMGRSLGFELWVDMNKLPHYFTVHGLVSLASLEQQPKNMAVAFSFSWLIFLFNSGLAVADIVFMILFLWNHAWFLLWKLCEETCTIIILLYLKIHCTMTLIQALIWASFKQLEFTMTALDSAQCSVT